MRPDLAIATYCAGHIYGKDAIAVAEVLGRPRAKRPAAKRALPRLPANHCLGNPSDVVKFKFNGRTLSCEILREPQGRTAAADDLPGARVQGSTALATWPGPGCGTPVRGNCPRRWLPDRGTRGYRAEIPPSTGITAPVT
jgi:hypothetical protein